MKKKFILIPLFGALMYIVLSSYISGPASIAGLERTGASGTVGCGGGGTSCHGSSATASTTVSIQLLSAGTPVTTYTGGGSYTIRITGVNTSGLVLTRFGFQVAVVKTATTINAGTLTAIAGTHTASASGINLVEHSSQIAATTGSGGAGTTYVVNIPWTAPVAGTGSVTIFSTLNAVNFNGGQDAGDKWNNTSMAITEASATTLPITGTLSVCAGATTALADATPGGTWTSGAPGVATISAAGLVTGLTPGTSTITYTAGGSAVTAVVTVNPTPPAVTGTATLCTGGTATLADAMPGGTWSSSSAATASVSATGVVTGVAAGTATITYTMTGGCTATRTVTVSAPTPVTGADSVCVGSTITLADATAGGTWSSGTTADATVSATGVVTGVAAGSPVISYTLPGGCVASKTVVVTRIPAPVVTGALLVCVGSSITLTGSITGGTWTSSNAHATAVAGTGVITGVTAGIDTIKYAVTNLCGTGNATHIVTVNSVATCRTGITGVANGGNVLKVYPNPAKEGNFTLNIASDMDETARVVITNVVGARVKEFTIATNMNTDVQLGQTPGIYILTAITSTGKQVVKVVVD